MIPGRLRTGLLAATAFLSVFVAYQALSWSSVQALLDQQADIDARTGAGQTALHLSAATGQPKLTRLLIERGADPQRKDFEGRTALYYAKKNFHPQTTAVLEQTVTKKPSLPAGQK